LEAFFNGVYLYFPNILLEAHPELTQADINNAWFYAETFPTEIEQAISANEED
jgi:uncharacterized protein (DUF433 family)